MQITDVGQAALVDLLVLIYSTTFATIATNAAIRAIISVAPNDASVGRPTYTCVFLSADLMKRV